MYLVAFAAFAAEPPAWTYTSDVWAAELGSAVAPAGDVNADGFDDFLVGAPSDYDGAEEDEGLVRLFFGGAAGPAAAPDWTGQTDEGSAHFGSTLAGGRDVNGDGYTDILAGAPDRSRRGGAWLFEGGAAGPSTTADWQAAADANGRTTRFGRVLALGDVDADGYAELVVGAWVEDGRGQPVSSSVSVFRGSATGPGADPDWEVGWSADTGYLVCTLALADVNGDGAEDLTIGDWLSDPAGQVLVVPGSAAGPDEATLQVIPAPAGASGFGIAISAGGDLDQDGYGDAVVGAPNGHVPGAYVHPGSASGLSATPAVILEGPGGSDRAGGVVAGAGDVDGDGYADVLLGGPDYPYEHATGGWVRVFRGGSAGVDPAPAWSVETDTHATEFGSVVAAAGDIDGDGLGEVLVGEPGFDGDQYRTGAVHVYRPAAESSGWEPDTGGTDPGDSGGPDDTGAGETDAGETGDKQGGVDAGCGCASTTRPTAPGLLVVVALAATTRRRR